VHKDSDMCVGYLFADTPEWARYQSATDFPGLEGLEDSKQDVKIGDVAREYYKATCKAVKMVDPNHLIFRDRFNGNKGIPNRVLDGNEGSRRCTVCA